MKIIKELSKKDDFSIVEVERYPKKTFYDQLKEHLQTEFPMLPWRERLNDEDSKKHKSLEARLKGQFNLRLAIIKDEQLVGWSFGFQDSVDTGTFYMAASMVLPEYQRRGLYSELVSQTLQLTREAGFRSVASRHIIVNNPVLIAKMKLGFTISGTELTAIHGNLVKLVYHHCDLRQKTQKFRAGEYGSQTFENLGR